MAGQAGWPGGRRQGRPLVRGAGVGLLVLAAVTGASARPHADLPGTGPAPTQMLVAPAATDGALASAAADAGRRPSTAADAVVTPRPPIAAATPPAAPGFDTLPAGPPPTAVPYGIGTRVYFAGHVTDLQDRFAAAFPRGDVPAQQRQFTTVTGSAGFAWTQFTGAGADVVHVVGQVSAAGGYTPFQRSTGRTSTLAVTTTGLLAMPESGQVYAARGSFVAAFTGSVNIDCGSCAVTAAGPRLVLDQWTGPTGQPEHQATWLWLPPAAIQRIDDRFRAVGRLGPGWLGLRDDDGCWRIAPATAPDRLGAGVCSLTTPLVDADGGRAVVVQAGRVRVVDPRTGAVLSTAALPAIPGWDPGLRYAVPAVWETADAYLVTVRVDSALALVRCSAARGTCQRSVRATVRPGVDRIVTERGPADAAPVA